MPRPKNPLIPEFYVYTLEAEGKPFYVGIGRSARASDRVRYVRYLMDRKAQGKPVKWVLSNKTVADHLRKGNKVEVRYLHQGLIRSDALARELEEITRLKSLGVQLANIQHN
jgi:hypothetical protein